MTAEPELSEPTRRAVRTVAEHPGGLVRRGQANGEVRADLDPEAAAWLLLSVLSARPLRAAVMPDPDQLEGRVAAVALGALLAPTPAAPPAGHKDHDRAHHKAPSLTHPDLLVAKLSATSAELGRPTVHEETACARLYDGVTKGG